MFEVIAVAVAIQVSVNWITTKLSPTVPADVQNIEVIVDADNLVCSKEEQFVEYTKFLGKTYDLQGLSTYDILEVYEYEVPKLEREVPTPDYSFDHNLPDQGNKDVVLPIEVPTQSNIEDTTMKLENTANSSMGFKGTVRDYKAPKTGLTPVPAGAPMKPCCSSKGSK